MSPQTQGVVLIVDDEAAIRRSVGGVLRDEGFDVAEVEDGDKALAFLSDQKPSLVLLDIWMPGMDGLEALVAMKHRHPDLPVVMISGHATIAAALKATRLGAADFIEKPLDIDRLLDTVKRVLGNARGGEDRSLDVDTAFSEGMNFPLASGTEPPKVNPVAFQKQAMRGKRVRQATLAKSAVLYGQGLHSGRKSGLILEPLPSSSGIHFSSVSDPGVVPAHLDYVESTGFATTVKLGGTQAGTIEHIMSTLHAYGISNLLVKCNGEVPVMDGSALDFCSLLEETGIEEQPGEWFAVGVKDVISYGTEKEFIRIEPSGEFTVDYTLEYPEPVGKQRIVFTLSDPSEYKKQIAPARTFGFVKDIGYLQKQGLALGGRFDNFVLFGEDAPINCDLRFTDEPVRHKVLDAIGDLFLLGRPIQAKVTAGMTGHSDNISLLKLLSKQLKEAVS